MTNLEKTDSILIKERPSLRYSLSLGLLAFIPALIINLVTLNSAFFLSAFISCTIFLLLLCRNSSIEISSQGIRQKCFGIPLYFIGWQEISEISYREDLPGPRYKIRSKKSWVTTIDLPIDDESFLTIKKALASQGVVLAKAQLTSSSKNS